jgi:hypothetical protein
MGAVTAPRKDGERLGSVVEFRFFDEVSMGVVLSVFLTAAVVHFLTWAYQKHRRNSRSLLGQLQGPKSSSFWIGKRWLSKLSACFFSVIKGLANDTIWLYNPSGNEGDMFYQNEVGDSEFEWMRQFGSAWRRRGCLGVSFLFHQM